MAVFKYKCRKCKYTKTLKVEQEICACPNCVDGIMDYAGEVDYKVRSK